MDFISFILKIIDSKMKRYNGNTKRFIIESVCNTIMRLKKDPFLIIFVNVGPR